MINTFESVKVLEVEQVTDLTSAFSLDDNRAFHICIVPQSGASYDVGEVMEISAQPAKNDSALTVPVVVGAWNPIVLTSIDASAIDLTTYNVYVSPIANY